MRAEAVGSMELEFLKATTSKIVRTTLYSDQEFSPWEFELLHTPIVQRLYNLKQLGFADKVFPDAVHSRFNHVLGVAEVAERMARRLVKWLKSNPKAEFRYAVKHPGEPQGWLIKTLTSDELAAHVDSHIPVVRLVGLLHDLTHAAFGHTLEDEVCVFEEKHDDPARQKRFFDALVAQLVFFWAVELNIQVPDPDTIDRLVHLEVDDGDVKVWAAGIREVLDPGQRESLAARLRELATALSLLLYIEFLHESNHLLVPDRPALLAFDVVTALSPDLKLDLEIHRDAFFVDIVGNTICADLMDYARRDPQNAGLRVQFDDRLIRYVCAVSVRGELSPTAQPCIRLALQFFTDKMRYDVVSEMSGLLRARYLITEGVLLHPTKCAAGAMLGAAIQLLGIHSLPTWMQILGDQEFLRLLVDLTRKMSLRVRSAAGDTSPADRVEQLVFLYTAQVLKECAQDPARAEERIQGARNLLWRLISRRYPKPAYRLRSGLSHSGGDTDESVANRYQNREARFELEREIERQCKLPVGSIVIHCPRRKGSMKVAQALVVGSDLTKVRRLRDVDQVTTPEALKPYHDEILAVEQMYRSIWMFHAFLDSAHLHKRSLVEEVLHQILKFPNDGLLNSARASDMNSANPYDLLAGDLHDQFAWAQLPEIVSQLDSRLRMRFGPQDALELTKSVIREVMLKAAQPESRQMSLLDDKAGS